MASDELQSDAASAVQAKAAVADAEFTKDTADDKVKLRSILPLRVSWIWSWRISGRS